MIPVLVRDRAALAAARADLASRAGAPVVLVPTMGALHAGHRALLHRARELAGRRGAVVVSVFVNPRQFGPGEDFDRYPRAPDDDMAICRAEGVDVVFAPNVAEMYPDVPAVTVDPGPAGEVFEGEFRPGFFGGVLTVVIKLFGLARPDIAVFGRTALSLSRALNAARDEAVEGAAKAISAAHTVLADAAAADPPLLLDYLGLADPTSFAPVGEDHLGTAVLTVAARVGSTRLIDNVTLVIPATGPPH